ncbi:MAG: fumarylacetoacetate hydrolase family protein [Paracoccaceae bacterium]|nr:fumarylacetoacetate hydrolase family protein [Paracoccaceae bacterium]
MRLALVKIHNKKTYGIIRKDFFYPIRQPIKEKMPELKDFISSINQDNINPSHRISPFNSSFNDQGYPLTSIKYLPPLSEKNKIICVGINYPKLYNNKFTTKPNEIIIFSKFFETLVGHDEPLSLPIEPAAKSFDYEGEVAVIIGKTGFKISKKESENHIFGFTLLNDGSVREWQNHSVHAGKNFYHSGSCGPYIVTKDEIKSVDELTFQTKLNGILVQNAQLSEMFFDLSDIIAYVSTIIPLNVGDVIATGSPEGTGASQVPERFLKKGDSIEISSPTLGTLKNTV